MKDMDLLRPDDGSKTAGALAAEKAAMPKLLACPFCEGIAERQFGSSRKVMEIVCTDCGARSGEVPVENEDHAAAAWNRRAILTTDEAWMVRSASRLKAFDEAREVAHAVRCDRSKAMDDSWQEAARHIWNRIGLLHDGEIKAARADAALAQDASDAVKASGGRERSDRDKSSDIARASLKSEE